MMETISGISSNDGTQAWSAERFIRARQASEAISSAESDTRLTRLLWIVLSELRAFNPSAVPVNPNRSARATALTSNLLLGVRNWPSSSTIVTLYYLKCQDKTW